MAKLEARDGQAASTRMKSTSVNRGTSNLATLLVTSILAHSQPIFCPVWLYLRGEMMLHQFPPNNRPGISQD